MAAYFLNINQTNLVRNGLFREVSGRMNLLYFDSNVPNEGERKDNCVMPLRLEKEEQLLLLAF